jgi:1-deoxy-D-xylulose-5-phosphate reductoisomerase
MIKKIGVLGSTGSIGTTLLKLINNDEFEIKFLSANKNYKKLLNQAKKFNVKNLIITNHESFNSAKIFNKDKTIKIYNNFEILNKIVNNKLDYVMSSIVGIDGLKPTFTIIKFTKKIAIANKESLICAWPLIRRELNRHKTKFIPVDSEHFTIWSELKNTHKKNIKKIYLTASGGPLLNIGTKKLKNIKMKTILKHPTWNMGKKISVDSATMMNKLYEVIEAKNIFDLNYNQIDILIHPNSYAHSIIVYTNGIIKIILHDTTMKIPIFNSLFENNKIIKLPKVIDINKMNNLNFQKINNNKFPVLNLFKIIPHSFSLFETLLVSINDLVVDKYLNKKISFVDISKFIIKLTNLKQFQKYKKIYPKNINEIINLNKKLSLKISKLI